MIFSMQHGHSTRLRSFLQRLADNLTAADSRGQVEFVSSCQAQAEQQAATLQAGLEAAEACLQSSKQELCEKDARLAHLEGEFVALKEVLGDCGQGDVVNSLLSRISTLQVTALRGRRGEGKEGGGWRGE